MLHEEQLHVARGRQAGREAAIDPLGLLAHGLLDAIARVLAAPGLAEGRVHEYEAHLVVGEAVLLHGVGEADVLGALALDEHVGQADGVGVGDDLLAVEVDVGLGAGAVELFLGAREHAARAAGEVAHLDDLARRGEVLAALREGKARKQAHDLARGVVVAGLGVLGEATDDFLEHVAHGHVVDRLGVEVELGELADNAGELGALPHLLDLLIKLEVGEDLLDVGREGVDVGLEIGGQRRGVGQELGERVAAGVVEGEPGLAAQDGVGHVGVCLVGGADVVLGGLEGTLKAAQDDHGKDDVAVLVGLVGAAQRVGDAEDGVNLALDVNVCWHAYLPKRAMRSIVRS